MRRRIKVADLLCGAGGSSIGCQLALEELGLEMEPLFATIEEAFENEMAGEKEKVLSCFRTAMEAADKVRCVHVVAPVDAEA